MNNCVKIFAIAAAFAVSANFAYAVDYLLEAGQSDTISTNVVYEKMTINGDLTVSGGNKVSVKKIYMTNGCVTVTGNSSSLSSIGDGRSSQDYTTTWNLYPDENGQYGKIKASGVRKADYGVGAAIFYLRAENEAARAGDGYIDFLELDNAGCNLRQAYNQSSLTGRITVASGGGTLYRRGGASTGASYRRMFNSGAWKIVLKDNAGLTFNFAAQNGMLNASDVKVFVEGDGNVTFQGSNGSNYPVYINRGALINNSGSISFVRHANDRICAFCFNDSSVIGPNVTALRFTTDASYETRIQIAATAAVTLCGDVELTGKKTFLTGGKIKIDATAGARSFKCNIKSGDTLVVEKIGAEEMVVSSTTNFSHLVVSEGTVRITEDCVIEDLALAEDAELIADGCYVTVPDGVAFAGALKTVNGGVIRKISDKSTVFYFSGGESVLARYGYSQKYWRWTFTRVAGGVLPLHLCGFYLFAADGTVQSKSLEYANPATEMNYPALSKGYARWYHHSSTNLHCKVGEDDWRNVNELFKWFIDTYNGNNFPRLTAPLINPDDPASHLAVEMRLKDTAQPIVGYNMRRTDPNKSYPTDWKVEASDDGLAWKTIETRKDVSATPQSSWYYTYDGDAYVVGSTTAKEHFSFAAYRKDGFLPMAEPVSLQADGGAVVDFSSFVGKQLVNALTVDCAAGTGILRGAKIAESGVLTITNADALSDGLILPLTLPESIDGANLKNWTVVVDGKKGAFCVSLDADGTVKLLKTGMMLIIR